MAKRGWIPQAAESPGAAERALRDAETLSRRVLDPRSRLNRGSKDRRLRVPAMHFARDRFGEVGSVATRD